MHANVVQVTVRAHGNDMGVQTFPLSEVASAKMQQIIDKGGYQYGDKITAVVRPAIVARREVQGKTLATPLIRREPCCAFPPLPASFIRQIRTNCIT